MYRIDILVIITTPQILCTSVFFGLFCSPRRLKGFWNLPHLQLIPVFIEFYVLEYVLVNCPFLRFCHLPGLRAEVSSGSLKKCYWEGQAVFGEWLNSFWCKCYVPAGLVLKGRRPFS